MSTVLGALLPLGFFATFLLEHGWDVPRFFTDLFAYYINAFLAMDVLTSALVLAVLVVVEARRLHRPGMACCLFGLCVGERYAVPRVPPRE